MSSFIINGGKRLCGRIEVGGSKNAALPIIFATVLTRGVSALSCVPDISDVRVALLILEDMGAKISRHNGILYIDTTHLEYKRPDADLVCRIRASAYLLGASLARFGRAHISAIGGCNFSTRPIDMHLFAAEAVGAAPEGNEIVAKTLHGADIIFKKVSVGATVNAILMTATARGTSRIYGYAREPHIFALVEYLRTAGASIRVFPDCIEIEGRELDGGTATVIPDMIEAGTYVALSLATGSHIEVVGINRADLSSFFDFAVEGGACLAFDEAGVLAEGAFDEFLTVETAPHPEFPTDLQPVIAPLLARYMGGRIIEGVWTSRFGYLSELEKFGVRYSRLDNTAIVYHSDFHRAHARSLDLRGGASLVIAALIAEGESIIDCAEVVDRGYEKIADKLRAVGASIDIQQ